MNREHKVKIALEIDDIVKNHLMPRDIAISLLSSAILLVTNQCEDPSRFADAIAHNA